MHQGTKACECQIYDRLCWFLTCSSLVKYRNVSTLYLAFSSRTTSTLPVCLKRRKETPVGRSTGFPPGLGGNSKAAPQSSSPSCTAQQGFRVLGFKEAHSHHSITQTCSGSVPSEDTICWRGGTVSETATALCSRLLTISQASKDAGLGRCGSRWPYLGCPVRLFLTGNLRLGDAAESSAATESSSSCSPANGWAMGP